MQEYGAVVNVPDVTGFHSQSACVCMWVYVHMFTYAHTYTHALAHSYIHSDLYTINTMHMQEYGAVVDVPDIEGFTPLHRAVENDQLEA